MPEEPVVGHLERRTTDPAQARTWLRELYCGHDLRIDDESAGFALHVTGRHTDRLRIETLRTWGPAEVSGGPGRMLAAIQVRSGSVSASTDRSAASLPERRWGMLDTSRPVQVVTHDDLVVRVVLVDPVDVATVAEELAVHERRPVGSFPAFTLAGPLGPHHTRFWDDTVDHVEYDLLSSDELMATPLLHREVRRTLATAMLLCFPNTTVRPPAD